MCPTERSDLLNKEHVQNTKSLKRLNVWQKEPIGYKLVYKYAHFCFRLFYSTIHIVGKNNIPAGKSVIFASNHQNALMDPLSFLFAADRPVYFLARADIFKKKFIARILGFLKLMPVYRLRDEVDIIEKDRQVFAETAALLTEGNSLGILPEGTHTPVKRLSLLKKGICRIAFETVSDTDFNNELFIVPVGIDYSDYNKQGSDLIVIFGKPLEVMQYYSLYQENANKAVARLRDDLADSIRALMINIDINGEYEFIHGYAEWSANNSLEKWNSDQKRGSESGKNDQSNKKLLKLSIKSGELNYERFKLVREEVEHLKDLYNNNREKYQDIKENSLFASSNMVSPPSLSSLIEKYTSPMKHFVQLLIAWIAYLLNFTPFLLAGYLSGNVKDPQFKGSIKYGSSLLLFPLWYIFLFIVGSIIGGLLIGLLITLAAVLTSILKLKYT